MTAKILRQWQSRPGMMATTEGLLSYADKMARRELGRHGSCQPQWIVVRSTNAYLVLTPFEGNRDKAFFAAWMTSAFLQDLQIERYAFICEAWITEFRPDAPGIPAGRRDALMINVEERSGHNILRTYDVSGKGRGRVLSQPQEQSGAIDGQLAGLFQM